MAVLEAFTVDDLVEFSAELRNMGVGAATMAEVGDRLTSYLRDNLLDHDGNPATVTVQLHKTHAFGQLPDDLRTLAVEADDTADDDTACLVRLAKADAAELPAPETPADRVRPLTPRAFIDQPIFIRLLAALGVDETSLLDPSVALAMRMQHRELNIYVEPDLASSELIDEEARQLVRGAGMVAIVALGGILPSGDLFLVSLITRVQVSARVADLLRSLGTAAKVSLIPFTFKPFG